MASETFLLKWENFLPNITDAFVGLRGDKVLCDVTLVCDDGEVDTHRIVLSASSTFFQKIFSKPIFAIRSMIDLCINILIYMILLIIIIVQITMILILKIMT